MAKKRDRALRTSLTVSLLIHLSAVTLFSVVIRFPREPLEYYSLRFVDAATREPIFGSGRFRAQPELRVPSLDDAFAETKPADFTGELSLEPSLETAGIGQTLTLDAEPKLPQVNIPQLEFAELSRLRLRRDSLRIQSGYIADPESRPQDSWAWFGQEIGQLRDSLRKLPTSLQLRDVDPVEESVVVSTPHPGFRAYVEWMTDPKSRRLLFSPPIDALMSAGPSDVAQPITLIFRVNPQGRVVEVLDSGADADSVAASASKALIKYRFAPVEPDAGDQIGTLVIVATDRLP